MTDPQNRRGLEKLGGYIGGCYVRARGIVSPFRTCAYVRVHACHIGAEAPNHEIDIPTLSLRGLCRYPPAVVKLVLSLQR